MCFDTRFVALPSRLVRKHWRIRIFLSSLQCHDLVALQNDGRFGKKFRLRRRIVVFFLLTGF